MIGASVAVAAWALLAAGGAAACGEGLRGPMQRIDGARYEIAFQPLPQPIVAGKHFGLDIAVCPRPGVEPPSAVRVDATMPEHRHGMNYRPVVVARGEGTYHADGLMFHMPGHWEVLFDLVTPAGTERLASAIELE